MIPSFAYMPGKAAPLKYDGIFTIKTLALFNVTGYRRALTPDEYQLYRGILEPDFSEVSSPVKAAVGVVLKADLARLYTDEYFKDFPDPLVEIWARTYASYEKNALIDRSKLRRPTTRYLEFLSKSLNNYLKARAELNVFEKFLVNTKLPNNEDLKEDLKNQSYFSTTRKATDDMRRDFRIAYDKASQDEERETEHQDKIDKDFADKFAGAGKALRRIWWRGQSTMSNRQAPCNLGPSAYLAMP